MTYVVYIIFLLDSVCEGKDPETIKKGEVFVKFTNTLQAKLKEFRAHILII